MREWQVNERVVVDCDAHQVANQLEVDIWLHRLSVKVVELDILVKLEHSVGRAQQLLDHELEVLFAHSSLIYARLACEANRDWQPEWVLAMLVL